MNQIRFIILCTLTAASFSGCSSTSNLYQLAPPNMPLPFNSGETKINFYFASQGYGLQASCAIDSHLVVMLNGHGQSDQYDRWYPQYDDNSLTTSISNLQTDIAFGYYTHWDTIVRFELLGGIGYGNSNYHDVSPGFNSAENYNVTDASGQFLHLLFQSDIGLVGKHVEVAGGIRFSNLNTNANYQFSYFDPSNNKYKYSLVKTADAMFAEPYLTFALGFKNVKLIASVTGSSAIFGPDITPIVPGSQFQSGSLYQSLTYSLGLLINLNRVDN